ncbi:MAG: hypothetical protein ACMUIA_11030 [bacterium]
MSLRSLHDISIWLKRYIPLVLASCRAVQSGPDFADSSSKATYFLIDIIDESEIYAKSKSNMEIKILKILLSILIVSIIVPASVAAGQDEQCVRGEPEPMFRRENPRIKEHSFHLKSSHEAGEEVLFDSGDLLFIENGGCEYFVNIFRYESESFQGEESNIRSWFQKSVDVLKILAEAEPHTVFDFRKAAATLGSKIGSSSDLTFDHMPYPVENDGSEFLQTQVVVLKGGMIPEKASGFVEFKLFKGPL